MPLDDVPVPRCRRSCPVRPAPTLTAGASFALLGLISVILARFGHPTAAFWPADGVALSLLLAHRGWRAPLRILASLAVAIFAADLLTRHPVRVSLVFAVANLAETAIARLILRPLGRMPDLLQPASLQPFLLAVLLGPAIGAGLAGSVSGSAAVSATWFASHALGLAIVTPVALDTMRRRIGAVLRRVRRRRAAAASFLAFSVAVGLVFAQTRYPLLFALPLLLVALPARLGRGSATTAVLPVALIGGIATLAGHGPVCLDASVPENERIIVLQVFVAAALATLAGTERLSRERVSAEVTREAERTRVRESEARYRLLADHAVDLVARADVSGRLAYVSPSSLRSCLMPSEHLLGRDLLELVHPEDREAVAAVRERLRSGADAEAEVLFRVPRADGRTVWMEALLRTVRDPATGRFDGFVWVGRDATERCRLDAERKLRARDLEVANLQLERLMRHLAEARDLAEHASQAKSRFLANMSHELRTPLNGLLGHSEMLRLDGGLSPDQEARVEAMRAAGAHLLGMINAVLDLSTIEADRMECRPTAVDLAGEAWKCLELVRPAAEAKSLALRLDHDRSASLRVVADPLRLRQVMLNLLGNAVKFTATGGVAVRIGMADPGRVRLLVIDSGPGIPPGRRSRLFGEFDRLDIERHTDVEGAGLGLSLSARLLSLMGGTIGHEDGEDGGSVFWIELPAEPDTEQAAPVEAPAQSSDPSGPRPATPRPLRVLVVDDVATNREVARCFLRSGGHHPVAVGSGREAIEALSTDGHGFDVVLMDARMPEMDGLETTRRVRALPGPVRDIPIIALTALVFAEQVAECRSAGMDLHLAKPVTRDAMLDAVERVRRGGSPHPAMEPEPASPPPAVFDPVEFERVASFLDPEAVSSCLAVLAGRSRDLLGAIGSRDVPAEELREAAHALAGSAGTFGFTRLAGTARDFERACRDRTRQGTPGAAEAAALVSSLREAAPEFDRLLAPRPDGASQPAETAPTS